MDKPGVFWEKDGRTFGVRYHEKIFLIVMDSVGHEQFQKAKTPNMDNGGFKNFSPAYSGATWTIPSVVHMMTGRLPFHDGRERLFPSCYWLPRHFHELGGSAHYLAAVGIPTHIIKYEWDTFHFPPRGERDAESIINKALFVIENFPNPRKFFYLHFEDTHSPYECKGNGGEGSTNWRIDEILKYNCGKAEIEPEYFEYLKKRQVETIEFMDKALKPLIDIESTMVITSDHSDVFGLGRVKDRVFRYFGHDNTMFHELLEVPLLVRV